MFSRWAGKKMVLRGALRLKTLIKPMLGPLTAGVVLAVLLPAPASAERPTLHLSGPDAQEALNEWAREHGFGRGIISPRWERPHGLRRVSRIAFAAHLETIDWGKGKGCRVSLSAERTSPNEIEVRRVLEKTRCHKLQPLSDGEALTALTEYATKHGRSPQDIHNVMRSSPTRVTAELEIQFADQICSEFIAAGRMFDGGISVGIASDVVSCRRLL
jgi:hypothetical protein